MLTGTTTVERRRIRLTGRSRRARHPRRPARRYDRLHSRRRYLLAPRTRSNNGADSSTLPATNRGPQSLPVLQRRPCPLLFETPRQSDGSGATARRAARRAPFDSVGESARSKGAGSGTTAHCATEKTSRSVLANAVDGLERRSGEIASRSPRRCGRSPNGSSALLSLSGRPGAFTEAPPPDRWNLGGCVDVGA